MDQKIQWAVNHMPKTDDKNLPIMGLEEIGKARTFHESFPQYSKTPLTKLDHMAEYLGVKEIYLKDESYRFGLNAFKVLGGSFAMARYIASETGKDVSELPYSVLTSDQLRKEFGQATFFTATDGNHGRGVAWAANRLGQKAVVHMPKGSTQTRLQNIAKEGAQVDIQEMNYDDCVRLAAKEADETERGVIVQDTAWDGYEEIPAWIMQGYGTMAMEAGEQLKEYGCERPTHIFVQAGVGSLAGAVVGYYSNLYGGGSRSSRMSLQGRCCRRRRHPHRGRRHGNHHGRSCMRRAKHHFLGYLKEPCKSIHRCPGLGSCKRHAYAGRSHQGRRACYIRRVRRCPIRRTGSRHDHG